MRTRRVFATSLATGLCLAQTALADLSASDLWTELQGLLDSSGAEVSLGDTRAFGQTVTIRDLVIRTTGPDGDDPLTITIPEVTFRDVLGDSVEAVLSAQHPVALSDDERRFDLATDATARLTLDRDTGSTRSYSLDLPEFDSVVQNLTVNDAPVDIDIAVSIEGLLAEFTAGANASDGTPVAAPIALSFNRFEQAIEGALITSTGELTFDTSPTSAMAPEPTPIGTISLDIDGANAMLQILAERGVLGQGEVLGAMFGLGFFTRAGEGPDTRISVIDFGADGSITVNGQLVR